MMTLRRKSCERESNALTTALASHVRRVWQFCSTPELLHQEMSTVAHAAFDAGFPFEFFRRVLLRGRIFHLNPGIARLTSKLQSSPLFKSLPKRVRDPDERKKTVLLPFAGSKFGRFIGRLFLPFEVRAQWLPAAPKLCHLVPSLQTSLRPQAIENIIYQNFCSCRANFVGFTSRQKACRDDEHVGDIRRGEASSAYVKHGEQCDGRVAFALGKVLRRLPPRGRGSAGARRNKRTAEFYEAVFIQSFDRAVASSGHVCRLAKAPLAFTRASPSYAQSGVGGG